MKNKIRWITAIGVPFLIYALPRSWIPVPGLTVIEHRLMAIFFIAALFWLLEPIPIFATSVLVIFLELVMVSDKSLIFFQASSASEGFGHVIPYTDILATLSYPIIMLCLG